MKQIDLDDLPPRAAKALVELVAGEALVLVRGGVVVGRLKAGPAPPAAGEDVPNLPDDERLKDVMEQFNAMIHDEF